MIIKLKTKFESLRTMRNSLSVIHGRSYTTDKKQKTVVNSRN